MMSKAIAQEKEWDLKRNNKLGMMLALAGLVLAVLMGVALVQMGEASPVYASGKIALDESLADKAKGIRILYLVVYDADSPMPMPYGAMKERLEEDAVSGEFFDFMITKEKLQVMMARDDPMAMAAHPKNIRVKVRLDKDGLAGMDQPGDLTGSTGPMAFGAENVTIKIDQYVQ